MNAAKLSPLIILCRYPALIERLPKHAERFATEIVYDHSLNAKLQQRPFKLIGEQSLDDIPVI